MKDPVKTTRLGSLRFLEGGGEMGERIRAFDWAATPLGAPVDWPQLLKILVNLMLASKQPMLLGWGPERTWLYNDAFIPILGRKHPSALGQPSLDVWSEARDVLEPLFDRVFAGEAVSIPDFSLGLNRRGKIEEAHFEFGYTPVKGEDGSVVGLFGVCIETTPRILEERRLAQLTEMQQKQVLDERRLSKLREQFIAVLGHDLRNPLAAIQASVGTLLRTPLNQAAAPAVGIIRRSADRIAHLIDDVTDLARSRLGGGLAIDRDACEPLAPVLRQVISELQASTPDCTIDADLAFSDPINCDRQRIGQLLSNLLSNTLAYGDKQKPVRVRARTADGQFELVVANSGEPIPPAALDTIFEPFTRGTVGSNLQGLGLGLYIAHQVATAHAGTLTAASSPEETRFTFRMPLILAKTRLAS